MAEWPRTLNRPQHTALCAWSGSQPAGEQGMLTRSALAAAAWPAANRALYVPLIVETPMTIFQLAMYNGAVAGEVDIGLYSYPGTGTAATRLVSAGKTAMAGASQPQVFNVADTAITPGVYFLGFVCSTVTTATFFRSVPALAQLQLAGVQQQALGETVLPATATFANPASQVLPAIMGIGVATL